MDGVRSMPLGSSEPATAAAAGRRGMTAPLQALGPALALLALLPLPLQAADWRRAAFPVASFAGFSSHFGPRTSSLSGSEEWHRGIDIAAPHGSPVRSWWGGVVSRVLQDDLCGVGLLVKSGAYEHIYCHLTGRVEGGSYRSGALRLQPGQRVRTGEAIGHVGSSGRSTGPHLHWGLRYRGRYLDPAQVLRAMAEARRQAP